AAIPNDLHLRGAAEIARIEFRFYAVARCRAGGGVRLAHLESLLWADLEFARVGIGLAERPKTVAKIKDVVARQLDADEDEEDGKERGRDPELDVADRLLVPVLQSEPGDGRIRQQHGDRNRQGKELEIGLGDAIDQGLQRTADAGQGITEYRGHG